MTVEQKRMVALLTAVIVIVGGLAFAILKLTQGDKNETPVATNYVLTQKDSTDLKNLSKTITETATNFGIDKELFNSKKAPNVSQAVTTDTVNEFLTTRSQIHNELRENIHPNSPFNDESVIGNRSDLKSDLVSISGSKISTTVPEKGYISGDSTNVDVEVNFESEWRSAVPKQRGTGPDSGVYTEIGVKFPETFTMTFTKYQKEWRLMNVKGLNYPASFSLTGKFSYDNPPALKEIGDIDIKSQKRGTINNAG